MTVGEKIRYFRIKKKLTQKELGILAGLGEQNANIRIAQYEADSRLPRRDLLDRIAQALEISPDDLSPTTGPVWSRSRCTNTSHSVNAQTLTELNTMINALYRWQNTGCIDEDILSEVGIVPCEFADRLSKLRNLMFGDALDWDVLCKKLFDLEYTEKEH